MLIFKLLFLVLVAGTKPLLVEEVLKLFCVIKL
jgi:hypothetical protein